MQQIKNTLRDGRAWYDQLNPLIKYSAPVAGVMGTGALAMGFGRSPETPAIQAVSATGQPPNPNEMSRVGDNVNMALGHSAYGSPLNDMEALQTAAKLSKDLYKFPEKKEKAIRDAEIEGQLQALTASALQSKYLN